MPTCGPPVILPPPLKRLGPPRRQGLCSNLAHLWATSAFALRSEAVGTRPWGGLLCSHLAHLWATSDHAPRFQALGTPPGGRGYVATLPTGGPPLIQPPALKRGPPRGGLLCSYLAYLQSTSDYAPRFQAVGRGYVATLPTCGPPLIVPPALKRWRPPLGGLLCSHLAHLWATSDYAPCIQAVGTPQAARVM